MVARRLRPEDVAHGTRRGYEWHKKWRVDPCQPCKDANTREKHAWLKSKQDAEARDADRKAAWQRACGRLAAKYPEEFREMLLEEMRGLVTVPPEDEGTG